MMRLVSTSYCLLFLLLMFGDGAAETEKPVETVALLQPRPVEIQQPLAPSELMQQPAEVTQPSTQTRFTSLTSSDQLSELDDAIAELARSKRDPLGGDVVKDVAQATERPMPESAVSMTAETIQMELAFPILHLDSFSGGTPAEIAVGGTQVLGRSTIDVGNLLYEAPSSNSVSLFKRPASTQPIIRGYQFRQINSQMNGGSWSPARWDLDTIVSKIDSGIVDDVVVVKGPYSAMYGPGLAFIDVVTASTPRSRSGVFETENWTSLTYDTNGQIWYGRQGIQGGAANWGLRASFGFRGYGGDYETGLDNQVINSSYKSRDIDLAFDMDVDADTRIKLHYVRQDLTDAEFFTQPVDIENLETDGLTFTVERDGGLFARSRMDFWFNETTVSQSGINSTLATDFAGGGGGGSGDLREILNVQTDALQRSVGYRFAGAIADEPCHTLTLGTDLNATLQRINELDTIRQEGEFNDATVGTNIPFLLGDPTATLLPNFPNESVFLVEELSPSLNSLTDRFDLVRTTTTDVGLFLQAEEIIGAASFKYGGRVDFVDINPDGPFDERDFTLFNLFMTNEYSLGEKWTLLTAAGHGQRAPSATELFTDETLIAGFQNGLNFIRGNNSLSEEKATQLDLGLRFEGEYVRIVARGYHTWVNDYIAPELAARTLFADFAFNNGDNAPQDNVFDTITPATNDIQTQIEGYTFRNTNATLSGIDFNSEVELTSYISAFGQFHFTEGRDRTRSEPLFGILPFQSRVGLRWERLFGTRRFGLEYGARLVAAQDRISQSQREQPTDGFGIQDLRGYARCSDGFLLIAGVTNLADVKYQEHLDFRDNPRPLNTTVPSATTQGPLFQRGRSFYVGTEFRY